ncbi:MAG: substrate-binding domain-containing protein [Bacteroidales bacterium]|nr:substrate-binding domain-containing protein [Anaerotignum sp.]MCI5680133.1 substrate-binding domain-containing protein [Bacteroidales bacterium]MDY3927184.1 substrate-binding domain-containing protein [Anaerotignum sp.]
MKKMLSFGLMMTLAASMLAGCGGSGEPAADESVAAGGPITVVSREDGSGTRGAFIELFGIEEKNDAGEKIDLTTDLAEITNSTAVMMTTVAGNTNAIGYVSLGSLDDSVKVLSIDGVEATVENIKNGTYSVARPFNIATGKEVSEAAQDFINFILSDEGQAVVEENGYISQGSTGAFESTMVEGKVIVAGSSSVTPVMEKLKEAYLTINTNASIEVQQSDSTTGMTSAIEGMCDIGMASRELKDSELEAGLTPTVIAMDGIAVVVNHNNAVNGLESAQVKDIFTGAVTDWSEVQ